MTDSRCSTDAIAGGERWPVLLATRAYGQLRKLERDHKVLGVVHKHIKQLSLGHFTPDSHRPVLGSTAYIPIYRSKLPFDLRIIYYISVEPDVQNKYDRQVIKILRIESRAQVDYQFWKKVSQSLSAKGQLYRDRCVYRLPSNLGGYDKPAMFPAGNYKESVSSRSFEYDVDDDTDVSKNSTNHEEELQNTVGVERYVPFSKALFNSVLADMDINLPMVLDTHEREIVNCTKASVVVGRSGTGKTTALIYKMRAINQLVVSPDESKVRQLFVTRSRVLAQHVESSYRGLTGSSDLAFKTKEELQAMAERRRQNPERTLAEFDTEIDLRDDLPSSFSALKDSNFPLFISFDRLCTLIEGDFSKKDGAIRGKLMQRPMIEFDEFCQKYWPRFKRQLTSIIDPALAYSEIIGVIKGSSQALETASGYLSYKEYTEKLPHRVLAQLPPQTRSTIYSIFEQYQRFKSQLYESDHADRTRNILKYFMTKSEQRMVEYMYVDEVQDNIMLDIHLLRRLCPNIQGTYWGGDTAQTVVAGSAFRIKDLTAFVHNEIRDENETFVRTSTSTPFSTFNLTVNFRSHSGIVNCAASIVELIYQLFPYSIDKLPTETARVHGQPPILFIDSNDDLKFFETFVLGSNPSSKTGFGAQQAILVRSDSVVEKMDSVLDGLCPILSISDSKGLEFDDVLLYNFFSQSSVALKDWRVAAGKSEDSKSFDDQLALSPALCTELKMLYVAITRARKRCWIWDSGPITGEMKNYWLNRQLITTSSASAMISRIGVSSTAAQWVEKGQEYFSRRIYKIAAVCFKQAGRQMEARVSSAYHQMTRAKLKFLRADNEVTREGLVAAARGMKECATEVTGREARNYWFHTASCLRLASRFVPASVAFVNGGFYAEAVDLLLGNEFYDQGASQLLSHWD